MSELPIENKVAKSGLIVLETDAFLPSTEILKVDLKDQLWEGIALKEKDFRSYIADHDWNQYRGAFVSVFCSADAIIPNWAFMLISSKLQPVATRIYYGSPLEFEKVLVQENIESLDVSAFADARVVVKGCGKAAIDFSAYGKLTEKLMPVARSIMFGEPCSTVPVYKKKA